MLKSLNFVRVVVTPPCAPLPLPLPNYKMQDGVQDPAQTSNLLLQGYIKWFHFVFQYWTIFKNKVSHFLIFFFTFNQQQKKEIWVKKHLFPFFLIFSKKIFFNFFIKFHKGWKTPWILGQILNVLWKREWFFLSQIAQFFHPRSTWDSEWEFL